MSIQEIKDWLMAHPTVKGCLIVVESTVAASLLTYVNSIISGSAVFSKTGLETFGMTILTATYLAVKNYLSIPASSVKKYISVPKV